MTRPLRPISFSLTRGRSSYQQTPSGGRVICLTMTPDRLTGCWEKSLNHEEHEGHGVPQWTWKNLRALRVLCGSIPAVRSNHDFAAAAGSLKARRSPPSGSFFNTHLSSNIIVGHLSAENAGHCGRPL